FRAVILVVVLGVLDGFVFLTQAEPKDRGVAHGFVRELTAIIGVLRVLLEKVRRAGVHRKGLVVSADLVGGLLRELAVLHPELGIQQNQAGLDGLREQPRGLIPTGHVVHDLVGLFALLRFLVLAERLLAVIAPHLEVGVRALLVVVERLAIIPFFGLGVRELNGLLGRQTLNVEFDARQKLALFLVVLSLGAGAVELDEGGN